MTHLVEYSINTHWRNKPTPIVDGKKTIQTYENKKIDISRNWQNKQTDINEFFQYVVTNGRPFTCVLLQNDTPNNLHRTSTNFYKLQVVCIDIDNGMTLSMLQQHPFYTQYGGGYYCTPTHTPEHNKFRIVHFLEQPITNHDEARSLILGLMSKYGFADQQCKDAVRYFNGSQTTNFEIKNQFIPFTIVKELISIGVNQQTALKRELNVSTPLKTISRDKYLEERDTTIEKLMEKLYSNNDWSDGNRRHSSFRFGYACCCYGIEEGIALQHLRSNIISNNVTSKMEALSDGWKAAFNENLFSTSLTSKKSEEKAAKEEQKMKNTAANFEKYHWTDQLTSEGRLIVNEKSRLDYLKRTKTTVRFNELQNTMVVTENGKTADFDHMLAKITSGSTNYGFPHRKNEWRDILCLQGINNSYHPVREWLNGTWDGVSRIKQLCDTIESPMDSKFKQKLITKWMVSAVRLVINDNPPSTEGVLIFVGKQGIGKTRWFKDLTDNQSGFYKSGVILDSSNKDHLMSFQQHWIVELGEISATFNKKDVNELKAFITSDVDKIRRPYDSETKSYPRRTICCGSSDVDCFLTDIENRRFWVIPVTSFSQMNFDVHQLWLEIKTLALDEKFSHFLTEDERSELSGSNNQHRVTTIIEDLFCDHFHTSSEECRNGVRMSKIQILKYIGILQPKQKDKNDLEIILQQYKIKANGSDFRVFPKEKTVTLKVVK